MGLFKDVRKLSKMGKEMSKDYDPVSQLREASDQMQQMTAQNELLARGTPAEATVVGMRDTGMQVNLQPVVEVDLTVFPAFSVAFAASATVQGHAQLSTLSPGSIVQVRYDPADPSTVVIG
jgi:hypothetical protein